MDERFLCRGKRKDNGEWVEGYLIQGNKTYIATTEAINYGDIIEYMDAYSDCNGEYTEFMNEGEVAYEDGSYFITNRSSVEMSDIVYKGKFDGNIIGNIHDNHELLQRSDEK